MNHIIQWVVISNRLTSIIGTVVCSYLLYLYQNSLAMIALLLLNIISVLIAIGEIFIKSNRKYARLSNTINKVKPKNLVMAYIILASCVILPIIVKIILPLLLTNSNR